MKIFPKNYYKNFETNIGACFHFKLTNNPPTTLLATTDLKIVEKILAKDDTLDINKMVVIEEIVYRIDDIKIVPDFFFCTLNSKLTGTVHKYNIVIEIFLRIE